MYFLDHLAWISSMLCYLKICTLALKWLLSQYTEVCVVCITSQTSSGSSNSFSHEPKWNIKWIDISCNIN